MIRSSKLSKPGQGSPEQQRSPVPAPGPVGENPAITAKGCGGSSVPGGQSQVSVGEVKGTLRGEAERKDFADE